MGLRHRSIRLRVGILIVVPVLCLIALFGFATSITLGNAIAESHAKALANDLLKPVGSFQTELAAERHLAVLSLASQNSTKLATAYGMQATATQTALTNMKAAVQGPLAQAESSARERQAIGTLINDAGSLSVIRYNVDAGAITIPRALTEYDDVVNQGYVVLDGALDLEPNAPLVTQALDVISLDQIEQSAAEENDLLTADVTRHRFPSIDRSTFAGLAALRANMLDGVVPLLDPVYQHDLAADLSKADSGALTSLEGQVIATPWQSGPPPPAIAGSGVVFLSYEAGLGKAIQQASVVLQNQAQHDADDVIAELILAAGFGLLGTIASIGLSLYIGRSLVRQLRNLRESAMSLANEKLPGVIRQLRAGEQVDLSDYVAPQDDESKDEIEQVQHAFNIVQQTAVQSAVDEARLRRGISDVFRNLAGRSQSLLHRQLTLLDGMERRATEPDELEDLFRIDHLTTRMRRHAEGLIILSGEAPARGWRQPVPLVDVLRAAVAEVEDYTRIRVMSRTRAAVAGHAVADVIHLVAELAENATVFSPPNTPVRIQGDVVGRGFAIEIEDRGLGISPERLAEINVNLADPPQFDLSGSDRLGLFIAGQLARRHDVTVTLRPSVYGGTTAIVLIPMALVVNEDSFVPDAALQAGQVAGRHAALAGAERGRLTSGNGHPASLAAEPEPPGLPPGFSSSLDPEPEPPGLAADFTPSVTLDPEPPTRPSAFTTGLTAGLPPVTRPAGAPPASRSPASTPPPHDPAPAAPAPSMGLPTRVPRQASGDEAPPDELDSRMTTAELAELGLPVRVRQASLAPQLRTSVPAKAPAPEARPASPSDPTGSPEAARSTVSALQRGWQLGRAQAEASAAGGPSGPGGFGGTGASGQSDGPGQSDRPRRTDGPSGSDVFGGSDAFGGPDVFGETSPQQQTQPHEIIRGVPVAPDDHEPPAADSGDTD